MDHDLTREAFEEKGRLKLKDTKTDKYIPAITLIRHKWTGESFFIGFQTAFITLAKMKMDGKKKVGAEAKNVFLFLLGNIDYENMVTISQIEIARELEMKKQNVSRAIKALINEGVLQITDPLRKRRQRMKLNDEYAWKGKLKTLRTERKKRMKDAPRKT
ncbi:MAG TPA: helix-turn-helix domain-containing protein [Nitrososphaera sp.]|nr:helix-turn-helix domain-containing protein [Nitrososphaera sp.]